MSKNNEISIPEKIASLYSAHEINLKTASRVLNIYSYLSGINGTLSMIENTYYNTSDNTIKLKLEIAFLISTLEKYLIEGNRDKVSINKALSRVKNILNLVNNNNLSDNDIESLMTEIICIEVDNGIDIRFLESANKYVENKLGRSITIKG